MRTNNFGDLTIVIPVHNEAKTIAGVVLGFFQVTKTIAKASILVAEDGSTDGTKEILAQISHVVPIRLISNDIRKGYLKAVKDALLLANSDLVFLSDSDNTHDPQDLLKILEYADQFDLVCGVRAKRHDPPYRILLSKVYNGLVWALFGIYLGDINCGFKLMRRDVVQKIVPEVKHLANGFSTELVIRAYAQGRKVKAVPVKHFSRRHGVADQFTMRNIPRVVYRILVGFARLKWELLYRARHDEHDMN